MPNQYNVIYIQTLKEMGKWETNPSNWLVVWWGPNLNDGIQDGGLHFKGSGWWRWNFQTNVCDVPFNRKRHFSDF